MGVILAAPALGTKPRVLNVLRHLCLFGGLREVERLSAVHHQQIVSVHVGIHIAVLYDAAAPRCLKRQAVQLFVGVVHHDGEAARFAGIINAVVVIVPQVHPDERRLIAISHGLEEFGILVVCSGHLILLRSRIVCGCSFCACLSHRGIHTCIVDGGILDALALAVDNLDKCIVTN